MTFTELARKLAEQTPANRNRAVDFFRAAAIMMVVVGHWIVNAPYYSEGNLELSKLLVLQPWTQFVTWIFQVMPIFFIVGGYSNAASWASAQKNPAKRYGWQANRLRRLLIPIIPLVLFSYLAAVVAHWTRIDPDLVRYGSRAALNPVWFLAVYILVTVAVPVSAMVWRRFGLYSVVALTIAAACVDLIAFAGGVGWLRWANYAFIWLALHQLGYWWHRGVNRILGPILLLAFGVGSLFLLIGPLEYPIAMISVPGMEVSNSRPPTFAMIAIGFVQAGVMLLVAEPVSRWMNNLRPWLLVVLVSQRIMTIYLWHITVLIALAGIGIITSGIGLQEQPGSALWWLERPIWIAVLTAALSLFVVLFGRVELWARSLKAQPPRPVRAVIGALLACSGLAFLALNGVAADNLLGFNVVPIIAFFIGVGLATMGYRLTSE